jgi:hypothetical protein
MGVNRVAGPKRVHIRAAQTVECSQNSLSQVGPYFAVEDVSLAKRVLSADSTLFSRRLYGE